MDMSDTIVGKMAYWKAPAPGFSLGHIMRPIPVTRCGTILRQHNGQVTVLLSINQDQHCPPDDDGRFLDLAPGVWKLQP